MSHSGHHQRPAPCSQGSSIILWGTALSRGSKAKAQPHASSPAPASAQRCCSPFVLRLTSGAPRLEVGNTIIDSNSNNSTDNNSNNQNNHCHHHRHHPAACWCACCTAGRGSQAAFSPAWQEKRPAALLFTTTSRLRECHVLPGCNQALCFNYNGGNVGRSTPGVFAARRSPDSVQWLAMRLTPSVSRAARDSGEKSSKIGQK